MHLDAARVWVYPPTDCIVTMTWGGLGNATTPIVTVMVTSVQVTGHKVSRSWDQGILDPWRLVMEFDGNGAEEASEDDSDDDSNVVMGCRRRDSEGRRDEGCIGIVLEVHRSLWRVIRDVRWRERVGIRVTGGRMSWVWPRIEVVIWGHHVQLGQMEQALLWSTAGYWACTEGFVLVLGSVEQEDLRSRFRMWGRGLGSQRRARRQDVRFWRLWTSALSWISNDGDHEGSGDESDDDEWNFEHFFFMFSTSWDEVRTSQMAGENPSPKSATGQPSR
ncbi:hypothetical protein B0H10DRAFT_1971195 [Mycena sp. CBHHK59/15]|nr:hypothetical protein B0H10DRAFT_1971195 [Mycena sp. CBHHK59/15]